MAEGPLDRPDGATAEERLADLIAELQRTPLKFQDESLAPQVDEELIRRLVDGALPQDEARAAYLLVYSFRTWNEAYVGALVASARRHQSESTQRSPDAEPDTC